MAHLPRSSRIKFIWEDDYKAAALETDDVRLGDRIQLAEGKLLGRFLQLTNREEDEVEIEAVEAALMAIHTMQRERLGK